MALRDIFKRKKEKPKEEPEKRKEKKVEEQKAEEKKEVKAVRPKKERKVVSEAYRILKVPHVTEKASDLTGKNQYVFKVWPYANKTEIKKAVGDLFGVDVVSVKIINVPAKRRRLGRTEGFRKGYKKALVKLKEGQKIEILPR